MLAEFLEAMLVDILDSASTPGVKTMFDVRQSKPKTTQISQEVHSHALRTSCNSPALLQAFHLAFSRVLVLALHKVIIVGLASRSNKETCRQQWRRAASDFLDRWDLGGGGELCR